MPPKSETWPKILLDKILLRVRASANKNYSWFLGINQNNRMLHSGKIRWHIIISLKDLLLFNEESWPKILLVKILIRVRASAYKSYLLFRGKNRSIIKCLIVVRYADRYYFIFSKDLLLFNEESELKIVLVKILLRVRASAYKSYMWLWGKHWSRIECLRLGRY